MRRSDREGSVLIIVLMVLAAAAYLIMESGKFLRIDYEGAAYQRVTASGGSLLHSGVTVARELLQDDLRRGGEGADHQFDVWANADDFFASISPFLESGELEGTITAEDGKIPLNVLLNGDKGKHAGEILGRLLDALVAAHEIDAKSLDYITSIKAWIGGPDTLKDTAWYSLEEPGYTRGGKFKTPHELRLVRWKGVSMEDRLKVLYGADGIPGLIDFVTVWGDKINMNVAPREVVAAVCPSSELRAEYAETIESYRNQGENDFITEWYKTKATNMGITQNFPDQALTVKSTVYRVALTARVGAGQMRSTTILKRDLNGSVVVLFENIH